ncbi:hypothetical protein B0H13DRAFT_1871841 [Mycena leptocephala]|nr:hypothetical protein B0H13DRAFT_1871841 [Mycena leptocephala]
MDFPSSAERSLISGIFRPPTSWIQWSEISPEMGTFGMRFEPEDTEHIGFRFRTMEMRPGTHSIRSAETVADTSDFRVSAWVSASRKRLVSAQISTQPKPKPKPIVSASRKSICGSSSDERRLSGISSNTRAVRTPRKLCARTWHAHSRTANNAVDVFSTGRRWKEYSEHSERNKNKRKRNRKLGTYLVSVRSHCRSQNLGDGLVQTAEPMNRRASVKLAVVHAAAGALIDEPYPTAAEYAEAITALHWVSAQPNVPLDTSGIALLVLGLAAAHITLLGGSIPRGTPIFRDVCLSEAGDVIHKPRPFEFVGAGFRFGNRGGNFRVELRNRATVRSLAPVNVPGGVAYKRHERASIGCTLDGMESEWREVVR